MKKLTQTALLGVSMFSLFFVLCLVWPHAAAAAEHMFDVRSGQLKTLRTHSATHPVRNAGKMQMFFVAGLAEGCNSVYLYTDQDHGLFAVLLGAFFKDIGFRLRYETDRRGPWGDTTSCAITSITFEE